MSAMNVPPALKQQIQTILNDRIMTFHQKSSEVDPRQGVGIAMEVTVRLLAPELFEQVLAFVQGRA